MKEGRGVKGEQENDGQEVLAKGRGEYEELQGGENGTGRFG